MLIKVEMCNEYRIFRFTNSQKYKYLNMIIYNIKLIKLMLYIKIIAKFVQVFIDLFEIILLIHMLRVYNFHF